MHIAAKLGNVEMIKALLQAGADPNLTNDVSVNNCTYLVIMCVFSIDEMYLVLNQARAKLM